MLCERSADGTVRDVGVVYKVFFTNLGGPFVVRVRFNDGSDVIYPFGEASPLFAVKYFSLKKNMEPFNDVPNNATHHDTRRV